jgi:hypothetical protein
MIYYQDPTLSGVILAPGSNVSRDIIKNSKNLKSANLTSFLHKEKCGKILLKNWA